MPKLVNELFDTNNSSTKINIESFTVNGATIESHYNNKKLESLIKNKNWDILILQEQSMRPIIEKNLFIDFSRKFLAKYSSYSKIYIFQTWPRKNKPEMHKKLSSSFVELKNKIGLDIIPVGEIWNQVINENPEINLYVEDLSHPNIFGSYLAALTFYKFLSKLLGIETLKFKNLDSIKIDKQTKEYLSKKVENYQSNY